MMTVSSLFKDTEKFKNIIEIFAVKGYHPATMDEIARATGVAKGTLYYHYKNKEDLYYSVIEYGVHILERSVRQALQNQTDPALKLKELIREVLNFFDLYSNIAFIFLRELYGNNIRRDVLSGLVQRIIQIIGEILAEGKEQGIFTVKDVDTCATAVFGAVSATAIRSINKHGRVRSVQVQSHIENLVFNGLLAE
ncbi:TetR/AcrR family transcriptional regulator [Desulfoscipio geothermicus]|uniref:Transcriptional regulator, TetR family n=1 Tax=Desulfoscipio geothermicus DSM 3669 TaxID=1121426 RepID=A0A1I6CXI4_9FIRM|nr:TetR/AcrR family transcriptional regulator [Desulfoscipio geothermicus]SFQ97880.1 transcriptional regulator, TetR family [Desulfoscipio geothermicus DSM 3669]